MLHINRPIREVGGHTFFWEWKGLDWKWVWGAEWEITDAVERHKRRRRKKVRRSCGREVCCLPGQPSTPSGFDTSESISRNTAQRKGFAHYCILAQDTKCAFAQRVAAVVFCPPPAVIRRLQHATGGCEWLWFNRHLCTQGTSQFLDMPEWPFFFFSSHHRGKNDCTFRAYLANCCHSGFSQFSSIRTTCMAHERNKERLLFWTV